MATAPSCMKLPYAAEIKINKQAAQYASLLCLYLILILPGVFITKESCLVIFSFNFSSFLINIFQLPVLLSYHVTSCTEIYF